MTYTITYVDAQGGGEVSTFVEADKVEYDPHWVTFYKEEPIPLDPVTAGCDNCGRTVSRPRTAFNARRTMVALYPTNRVRRVEMSTNAGL